MTEFGDILDVVSHYLTLTETEAGTENYCGHCPFCDAETATLAVSPSKGFFYCHACGTGGNAPKFLSLMEKIS